ncbi:carbohydrate sulfotransferase 5-like [Penaeus japonicus]|uniref:carbohydrate sulfotransferase 5-like n=1 Tax=Penaeus japonicus TaxID=27405 RepID=UPI001C70D98B|nr:carbohydrate sulfotransferase 5-like [Penaeus japonicus]
MRPVLHHFRTLVAFLIPGMVFVIWYCEQSERPFSTIRQVLPETSIAITNSKDENFWRFQNMSFASSHATSIVAADERASEEAKVGLKILILSSVGRSGSSFLAELISQLPNTFYVFEPMMFNEKSTSEGVNPRVTWDLLKNIFSCKFDHDWLLFARRRSLLRTGERNPCARLQGTSALSCVREYCLKKTNIVIKVIRMRISWITDLLTESGLDLKIIHLVRDPRATFRSSRAYVPTQKDYGIFCPRILEDLQMIKSIQKLSPNTLTSVKYEDLCLDTEGVATRLWRFISGDSEAGLPPTWSRYIEDHTNGSNRKGNAYSTWRDTKKEAEEWRGQISTDLLQAVEEHCGGAIDLLGHNRFQSLENVRNFSIPLMWTRKPPYTLT